MLICVIEKQDPERSLPPPSTDLPLPIKAGQSREKLVGILEFPLIDVLPAQGENLEQRQRLLGVLIVFHVVNDELRQSASSAVARQKQSNP
ncbi:hypothetical protein [Paraburkholderia rhynchosiae]